jgi:hypothetical protein
VPLCVDLFVVCKNSSP